MGITYCMFLVPTLIAGDFKGKFATNSVCLSSIGENGKWPEVKKVSRAPVQFPPELYSQKKVSRAFSATLFFFDVSRAFFSTHYSQLVFTDLTVELQVAVEKKSLLATCNSSRKEGHNTT